VSYVAIPSKWGLISFWEVARKPLTDNGVAIPSKWGLISFMPGAGMTGLGGIVAIPSKWGLISFIWRGWMGHYWRRNPF